MPSIRLAKFLGLASVLVSGAAACQPDFAGKEVFVFVTGAWSASPIAAGSAVNWVSGNIGVPFTVTKDASQNYSFR